MLAIFFLRHPIWQLTTFFLVHIVFVRMFFFVVVVFKHGCKKYIFKNISINVDEAWRTGHQATTELSFNFETQQSFSLHLPKSRDFSFTELFSQLVHSYSRLYTIIQPSLRTQAYCLFFKPFTLSDILAWWLSLNIFPLWVLVWLTLHVLPELGS